MAESEQNSAAIHAAGDDETESTRTLQLLPGHRQLCFAMDLSPGSGEAAVQMVEQEKPKTESDMGTIQSGIESGIVSKSERGHAGG